MASRLDRRVLVLGACGLVVALAAFFAAKRYAANVARTRVTASLTRVAAFADVDYEDVTVDLPRPTAHVRGLTIKPVGSKATIRIADAVVRDVREGAALPTSVDVALRGITVDAPDLTAADRNAELEMLVDSPIAADVELSYRYDAATQTLSLDRLALGVQDLFTTSVAVRIGHCALTIPDVDLTKLAAGDVDPLAVRQAVAPLLLQLQAMALEYAELRFDDQGMLGRAALVDAVEAGVPPSEIVARMLDQLDGQLAVAGPAVDAETGRRLKEFVARPGTLRVTANPKIPVPLMRFAVGAAMEAPPDLHLAIETSGRYDLGEAATSAIPRLQRILLAAAQRGLEASRWNDSAVAIQRARVLAPADGATRTLEAELRRRSGWELDIRNVDFRNFTYSSWSCAREQDLRNPIVVRNGELSVAQATFSIGDVLYGDLDGDGLADAVALASCNSRGANYTNTELFVFTLRQGKVVQVASIGDDRVQADYRQAWGGAVWPGLRTRVADGRLTVTAWADGYHAQPRYETDLQYRLTAGGMMLAGRPERREAKFDDAPAAAASPPPPPSGALGAQVVAAGMVPGPDGALVVPAPAAGAATAVAPVAAAGATPSLPGDLPFPVGAGRDDVHRRLGAPSFEKGRGYWANTSVERFDDVVPGWLTLGYLYDVNTLRVRQSEATFADWPGADALGAAIARMVHAENDASVRAAIGQVAAGGRRASFSVGGVDASIERQDERRIYVAAWERGTHRR